MLFDDFFDLKQIREDSLLVGSNTEAIIMVASEPGAIGYVSIASAEEAISLGVEISIFPIDGIAATMENVAQGLFPLQRDLNLVTRRDESNDTVMRFIRFMQSDAGQKFIRNHKYIPISSSKREPNL
jgi:phosphate transport system substrate-binding protein